MTMIMEIVCLVTWVFFGWGGMAPVVQKYVLLLFSFFFVLQWTIIQVCMQVEILQFAYDLRHFHRCYSRADYGQSRQSNFCLLMSHGSCQRHNFDPDGRLTTFWWQFEAMQSWTKLLRHLAKFPLIWVPQFISFFKVTLRISMLSMMSCCENKAWRIAYPMKQHWVGGGRGG